MGVGISFEKLENSSLTFNKNYFRGKHAIQKIISLAIKECPDSLSMLDCYSSLTPSRLTNNQILAEVSWIIYSSGFKFDIIKRYWQKITDAFRGFDVNKVAKLSVNLDVHANDICYESGFKNVRKASWCIKNASRIIELEDELSHMGGLKGYFVELSGLDTLSLVKIAPIVLEDLKFKGIGPVTIFHLMKNLGLDIFKPDIHVCRLLERVGLINPTSTILEIYAVMSALARANGLKVKELDTLLFTYGKTTSDYIPNNP